jgi:hypothetical protein
MNAQIQKINLTQLKKEIKEAEADIKARRVYTTKQIKVYFKIYNTEARSVAASFI